MRLSFRGLELGHLREMLLFAAYDRSSLARGRNWLEMAARARPGAADGSKWPLEPEPDQQNTRRVPLESAWSRRMLDGCRSSLPRSRRLLEGCRSSAPEPQNARRVPLEPPQRRRMLDGCRLSLPWSRSMLEQCRSSPQP